MLCVTCSVPNGLESAKIKKTETRHIMSEKRSHILWQLFITFFKIGAFTFGGGYAMIALLEGELVTKKKWVTQEEFLDIVAIAESTPGPVAINSATFIGYKMAGVVGSALATLGTVLPSFTIIYIISLFFDRFMELKAVASAFKGIQACVVYLIFSAGLKLFKGMKKKPLEAVILAAVMTTFIVMSVFAVSFSSIWMILASGAAGIAVWLATRGQDNSGVTTAGETKGGDRK